MSGPTTSKSRPTPPPGVPPGRRLAAFTLIELMVALAIMGMAMLMIVSGSEALLPATRLAGAAKELGARVELSRMQALSSQQTIVFVYDINRDGSESYYPYERNEKGEAIGVGRFQVFDFKRIEKGMAIREIRLPGSEPRTADAVALEITPQGRMTPHDVIVHNPDYPDSEVLTVRVHGLGTSYEIIPGGAVAEIVDDATFR